MLSPKEKRDTTLADTLAALRQFKDSEETNRICVTSEAVPGKLALLS